MRTNWHDIIAGYREHAAWRHLRNAIAVLAAGNWVGCGHTQSAPSSAPPRDSVTFVVEVVDANGVPLADVDVEGLVDVNPGPAESTCCMTERFAAGTTGERGVVILEGAPYTFRPFHFRASYLDWPTRTVGTGVLLGLRRVVRISLGPARDVRGQPP